VGGFDTGTVNIQIAPVNDAPVAVDDAYTIDEDGVVTGALVNVLANDSDVDNSLLSLSAVLVTGVSNGTLELHADGGFSYAPNGNFNGIDSFTYRASDGTDESNLATVTVTINAVNDPPLAQDALVLAVEDTPVSGVLQAQDVDGDELEFGLAMGGAPTKGSVAIDAVTGAFTYTPGLNENGFDSFVFVVSDGVGGFDTGTVNIQIAPVNDAPVLAPIGSKTVDEQTLLTFTAAAADVDAAALTFSLDSGAPAGATIDVLTGVFTWTPTATQGPGTYEVTVRVTDDGTPAFDDFETITIVVNDAATGGIDLVGTVDWNPDDLLIPGDREHVTVMVSNIGDTPVHDQVRVKIYASADTVLDASDIFLDDGHTGGNIRPGSSKSAQLNFEFPITVTPGTYFLLAAVDAGNTVVESNEANNIAIGPVFNVGAISAVLHGAGIDGGELTGRYLPAFDFGSGGGVPGYIDWDAPSGAPWSGTYSPFGGNQAASEPANFSEYLMKLGKSHGSDYDQLGATLLTGDGQGKRGKWWG
jgi:VCBS repeat-containing protein